MNYKINQTLYNVCVADDGTCTMDTYKVRTIRGGLVYAILLASFTWGKKSKKHGDFGWLDPIPAWCRDTCRQGDKFLFLETTKLAAWKSALKTVSIIFDEDEEEGIKAKKTIKAQITKGKGKK